MYAVLESALSNTVIAAGMALAVCLVTRWWKNRHVAHLLWLMVLAKLVTPPLWQIPLPIAGGETASSRGDDGQRTMAGNMSGDVAGDLEGKPDDDPEATVSDVSTNPGARGQPEATVGLDPVRSTRTGVSAFTVAGLWILTSGPWVLVALWRILRFHRVVRRTDGVDEHLMSRTRELATRIGLADPPDVRLLDGEVSPMVWPLSWRPVVLLPRKLVDELTPAQLDTILAHEFAHLVRHDDFVRFLEVAATCLFWWNPVVWWARHQLRAAEEDCCDALVVCSMPDSRKEYGEALLRAAELVSFGGSLPALASAMGQKHGLKRRIQMVLNHRFDRSSSLLARLGVLVTSVLILPLAGTVVSEEGNSPGQGRAEGQPAPAKPKTGEQAQDIRNALDYLRQRDSEKLGDRETRTRIAMYESAFRMQAAVSRLVARLEGPDTGPSFILDQAIIDLVRRWIAAGWQRDTPRETIDQLKGGDLPRETDDLVKNGLAVGRLTPRGSDPLETKPEQGEADRGPGVLVYLSEYIPAVGRSSATATGVGLVRVSGDSSPERSQEQLFRSALTPEGIKWFDSLKNSSVAMITRADVVDFFKHDALDRTFSPSKGVLYFVILPGARKGLRLVDVLTERLSISSTSRSARLLFGLSDGRN